MQNVMKQEVVALCACQLTCCPPRRCCDRCDGAVNLFLRRTVTVFITYSEIIIRTRLATFLPHKLWQRPQPPSPFSLHTLYWFPILTCKMPIILPPKVANSKNEAIHGFEMLFLPHFCQSYQRKSAHHGTTSCPHSPID